MALIPGNSGTTTKAVDGLEGATSGAPVVFPSGFQGSQIPTTLADADFTMTAATNSVVVMTPTATRTITLPSTSIPANYSITVINRSASFSILVNSSGGGLVATVGLGQVTVLSTQASPTAAGHWSISTNGAVLQGGNSFGTGMTIGTNDNNSIAIRTNGSTKLAINADGAVTMGLSSGGPSASHIARLSSTTVGERGFKIQNTNASTGTGAVELSLWSEEVDGSATPVERVRLVGSLDAADTGGKFQIFTRNSGTLTEQFSVNRLGQVTIGPSGAATHTLNTNLETNGTASLTMTNGPGSLARNPIGYISIVINGTTRCIPYWAVS
jgi:hypothetical protein